MSSSKHLDPLRLPQPSELEKWRDKIGSDFNNLVQLVNAVRQPVPDQTDGGKPLDPKEEDYWVKQVEGDFDDLAHIRIPDVKALVEISEKMKRGEPIDDRLYLMEGLIKAAAKFPQGSKNGAALTSNFLTTLWNDLQHPPQSMLGDQYVYRSADGTNNSLVHPHLGAAGMPYARTVPPKTMQPPNLPDPGVIFDCIMARKDENREPHPNRLSSVLFYLASIIIHDLFKTDHTNFEISQTSSYLDLAPLYGSNQKDQDAMRTKKDGKIYPDCFSEKRLLGFPPGVSVLLIMFNRFHNYVVENLALINEGGRFTKPSEEDSPQYKKYDEDLFQTGRLIVCGLYINIILIDYVRTILNLNRTDSNWQLNPREVIKDLPVATGNQVSAEFNLVYRWHSAISARDEKWSEEQFKQLFPDVEDPRTVGEYELLRRLNQWEKALGDDPTKWPIAGLERDPKTGQLPDTGLVEILTSSIEDPANSFGANRVPVVMRAIEILGIKQARAWNLATLNELRQHFDLLPHREFTDINPDKEVADQLRHLYGHPDLVEMYPGLVAEAAKDPKLPGSGLCPSYTVSRAVLSDAVALVRGDRFYTVDYHPKKLTNWGYSIANFDMDIDNGCVIYKLFMRAFPDWFEVNSVYAHYPMTVPQWMHVALQDLKKDNLYSFDRPKFTPQPKLIFSYAAAEKILGDKVTFNVTWGKAIEFLMGVPAKNFMLAGDGFENEESRKMMGDALYIKDWTDQVSKFYEKVTVDLLKEKSYKLAGVNQVDIVRDVGNLAHVRFCAELFMLPLKGKIRPGVFDEYQLYLIMAAVFTCVFFDLDPVQSFPLRLKAREVTQMLGKLVQFNVQAIKNPIGNVISQFVQQVTPSEIKLSHFGQHLIERLLASGMDVKDLVWGHIMGTAGGMVPNQGQLLSQTLDYFLTEGQEHLPEIQRLARSDKPEDFDTLMHYLMEGGRLYGETGVFRWVTKDCEIEDDGRVVKLKAGDKIMVNLRSASHDPKKFPNPTKVDLKRPLESYIHLGYGPHQCLGLPMTRVALTTMLKVLGRLENLRPAKGAQGRVQKVLQSFPPDVVVPEQYRPQDAHYHAYLTEDFDSFFPFPTCLKVNWDGDIV